MPGVLDPVAYHPLLAGAPLDHQPQAEVGLFGHLHLQAAAGVAADDRTVLPEKEEACKNTGAHRQRHPSDQWLRLSVHFASRLLESVRAGQDGMKAESYSPR